MAGATEWCRHEPYVQVGPLTRPGAASPLKDLEPQGLGSVPPVLRASVSPAHVWDSETQKLPPLA